MQTFKLTCLAIFLPLLLAACDTQKSGNVSSDDRKDPNEKSVEAISMPVEKKTEVATDDAKRAMDQMNQQIRAAANQSKEDLSLLSEEERAAAQKRIDEQAKATTEATRQAMEQAAKAAQEAAAEK
ncbi:MAG: hypothetical protein HC845_03525 [Akkermansiaceae bacterium]|nr:hypothetical protein [Akkermansiaceae bacterium]